MIKVYLDDQDITDSLNKQYPLPIGPEGILPDASAGKWYDLLRCISDNSTLKAQYFQGGVHRMKIVDTTGRQFEVKLLTRSKYSARNH